MSTTLMIRNLDEGVKHKLRLQAASHRRSMEAEAREIITRVVNEAEEQQPKESPQERMRKAIESVTGIWENRGSTDELMQLTRGED